MKFLRTLSPILVLGMAVTVTAGSIYVTVKAASQPADEAAAPAAETEPAPVADEPVAAAAEAVVTEAAELTPAPTDEASASGVDEAPAAATAVSHYVQLDAEGGFSGRLVKLSDDGPVPAEGLAVQIFRDGAPIASATTNEEGEFSVGGVNEGVIALVATGNESLLLYSVYAVGGSPADAMPVKYSNTLELTVNSAVIAGPDATMASHLVFGTLPQDASFGNSPEGSSYVPGAGPPSTTISAQPVSLGPDGSLSGVILDSSTGLPAKVEDTKVHFIRDGAVVGTVVAAPSGQFTMTGLTAGIYGVVSNGKDGVSAMAVEVVEGVAAAQPQNGKYKLTSMTYQGSGLTLTPIMFDDESEEEVPPAAGLSDGGGGGGGGGGFFPPIIYWDDDDASPAR